jgi:hypothetical protein
MSGERVTLEHLLERHDLSEAQAAELLRALTQPDLAPSMAGALLAALRAKGVTAAEVRGFAGAMRDLARKSALAAGLDAIDIVGTGGDASGSLNLSTGAALLTAACGLPVVKHGNRSMSSRSGSADLIEQLGFEMPLDERAAVRCFEATGFTFLFAPYFHPAMKSLAPVRSALGVRTVFNLLGPLTNPAAPRYALIGAFDAPAAQLMADTLAGMNIERAWVVHGAAGWPIWPVAMPPPISPPCARCSKAVIAARICRHWRCKPESLFTSPAAPTPSTPESIRRARWCRAERRRSGFCGSRARPSGRRRPPHERLPGRDGAQQRRARARGTATGVRGPVGAARQPDAAAATTRVVA